MSTTATCDYAPRHIKASFPMRTAFPMTFMPNIRIYKKEHSWEVLAKCIDSFCGEKT